MRLKSVHRCQQCGYSAAKPMGQCPDCQAWNSMIEEVIEARSLAAAGSGRGGRAMTSFTSEVQSLKDIRSSEAEARTSTGLPELDRLLGGGIVAGQVILLAGPPGIGKSTLMLQAAARLARKMKMLYISGEESLKQVSARAKRLGLAEEPLYLLSETDLSKALAAIDKLKPGAVVLDSIQTAYHPELSSGPGSVAQVRECASELLRHAKTSDAVVFLLGHVTKEGALAGPKVLEHIVDTVLYFDTEQHDLLRVLRPHKNRFGPTDEVGLFEMGEAGLKEVKDAASYFLADRAQGARPGSAVSATLEGSRPCSSRPSRWWSRRNTRCPGAWPRAWT